LILAACGNGASETAVDNLNHTTIQATNEIQITIAYVTDELLSHFESFVMFYPDVDSQTDDGIAFIPNIPVLNFRYIKINGAEVMFIVEEDLLATGSIAYGGFAFTATTDLRESELFTIGIASDPWIENQWQPFYVNEVFGHQNVLYRGEHIVVPWQPSSHFGIGFLDKYGIRRNFIISFDGIGDRGFSHLFSDFFFPLFINEFTDRGQEVDGTNNSNKTVMQSNENIQVIVDGAEVIFDRQQPMVVDGHIMIPIEAVFAQLGAEVELYTIGADYRVLIRGLGEVSFNIGEEAVYIHPVWHISNPPSQMVDDCVMLPVDIVVTAISERGHFAIWDEEQLVLNIFGLDSGENKRRVVSEAANWYRERGINAIVLQDGDVVGSHMLFARPGLGFSIFYITIGGENFIAVNSELDGDQAAEGIFVTGRERTQFVTWRNERGFGSPIFAQTFIQIFEDEEELLKERFPNAPNP